MWQAVRESRLDVVAVAVAVAVLVNLPALRGPFFGDDGLYVTGNGVLQATPLSAPWRFFAGRTNDWEYLPLRDLSYRLDIALFGMAPAGYHAHNLVLYALACAAAWAFFRSAAALVPLPPARGAWVAAAATLIFASHPAHVEAVAWISGRKDVLSGLFAILSLWRFAEAVRKRQAGRPARADLVVSASLYAAALLSKAAVLALPFAVFLLGLLPASGGRFRRIRRALALAGLHGAVAAAATILHLSVAADTGLTAGALHRLEQQVRVGWDLPPLILGMLVRIAVFPVHPRLIYDLGEPGLASTVPLALATVAVVAAVLGVAALVRGGATARSALAAFGIASAGALCVPYLQIVPFNSWSPVAERFLFLPLLGVALAAAAALDALPLRAGRVAAIGLSAILFAGSAARSVQWRTQEELVISTIAASPRHHVAAWMAIEKVYLPAGRFDEALRVAENVRDPDARDALSGYAELNHAFADGKTAVVARLVTELTRRLDPGAELYCVRLANIALEAGLAAEAESVYRRMLAFRPSRVTFRYNLGLALQRQGRTTEAATEVQRAVDEGFRTADAWNKLGILRKDLGQAGEAEAAFRSALAADPGHWFAGFNLARLLAAGGRSDEARAAARDARNRALAAGGDPAPVEALLERLGDGR